MRLIMHRALGLALRRCATNVGPCAAAAEAAAAAAGTSTAEAAAGAVAPDAVSANPAVEVNGKATKTTSKTAAQRPVRRPPTFVLFVAEHSRMNREELMQLPPERQVVLAVMYLRLTDSLRRSRELSYNVPWFSLTRQLTIFQLAVTAIAERRVPITLAVKLLNAKWSSKLPSPLQTYRKEVRDSIIAWVTELILQNKLTVDEAAQLLPMSRLLVRNASIIGTLVEKVLADPSPTVEHLINILFAIRDGRVNPPHATLDAVLQKILSLSNSFTTRQIFRTALAASGIQYPILVRLTPMIVRAWGDMAVKAQGNNRKVLSRLSSQRRLKAVTTLGVNELAQFTRLSASVGIRYGATLSPLALTVLVPLIRFSLSQEISVLLSSLAVSQCHDPAVYQAIANKLTARGVAHPLTLFHLGQVLRAVVGHSDLLRSMRIGGLLEILVNVSNRCGVLRQAQLLHFALDAYQLTRRYSRDAHVVSVMSKVVEEFCHQQLRMVRVGLAHMDIVNHTLEVSIMLGMRRAPASFPGMAQLLKLRNEIYAGVDANGIPARYRTLQHADVFALYHQIVAVNQHCGLFRLRLMQGPFRRFRERIDTTCALHILHAIRLYGMINERHIRLMPTVEEMLASAVRRKFHRLAQRETEGTARFRELVPAAFDATTVRHFLSLVQRCRIPSVRNDPRVVDGLVAFVMEFGDEESKKVALNLRDAYYTKEKRLEASKPTPASPAKETPVAEAAAAA